MSKKTVLVGLSGGIDSSVAALLLQQQGYDVVGVFLQFWSDPLACKGHLENKCCSDETLMRAKEVSKKLGIPLHVIDFSEKFKKHIVDYFLENYKKGWTPNPCVMCNKYIKFGGVLEELEKMNADFLATGHYAVIKKKKDLYELWEGKDKEKDQSYFLYTLTQEKLQKVLFPLGNLTKKEVREIAKKLHIDSFETEYRESQNLCFYPEKTPEKFLERYLPKKLQQEGPITTLDGKQVGTHTGFYKYTVGQRKGLDIGGLKTPLYVIKLLPEKNTVYVGEEKDLYTSECLMNEPVFLDGIFPDKLKNIDIKVRYTRYPIKGTAEKIDCSTYKIIFKQPVRAVTTGQSIVLYTGEKVLGGGIITR